MTPLRQQMIDQMQVRGFATRTQRSYLWVMIDVARYFKRSPDQLSEAELQAYLTYLVKERGLAPASCRLALGALRFFYQQVLGRSDWAVTLLVPKRPQRIPELLTRREVRRILGACTHPKHRLLLTTCYGCGLRVSELVQLQFRHIDGERGLLRIEQGKGAKDRQVVLPLSLLTLLRAQWRRYRGSRWVFPRESLVAPVGISTAQKVYQRAKAGAGIDKVGGIHSLRHAYATHQLEAGLPVHELQRLLGHTNLQSTLRYVHWVPRYRERNGDADLLAALEVCHARRG